MIKKRIMLIIMQQGRRIVENNNKCEVCKDIWTIIHSMISSGFYNDMWCYVM